MTKKHLEKNSLWHQFFLHIGNIGYRLLEGHPAVIIELSDSHQF